MFTTETIKSNNPQISVHFTAQAGRTVDIFIRMQSSSTFRQNTVQYWQKQPSKTRTSSCGSE